MWSAVEVFPALGLHDFVVADDASVRLARIVHRLGLGRVRVGFELGSQRFRLPVGLGLGRIVELEWNKALRRGEGESVDCSPGILLDLLGREAGAGWTVVLGQVVGLGLHLARTAGDRRNGRS